MNESWKDYLVQNGAEMVDNRVGHFGNANEELQAIEITTIIADISHLGLLRIEGEDSQAFLQGQFSNDVREVSPSQAQYSSYCTPKGRMLASFLLWQADDSYFVQLPRETLVGLQKKLSMYIMRSKVKITDASDGYVRFVVAGKEAQKALRDVLEKPPSASLSITQGADFTVIGLENDRFEIIASAEQGPALWEKLTSHCKPVGSGCWDWLNIQAGIPVIYNATQEEFIPQMVNFELIGGVNFRKGCYPGQEIVARTQHLGKTKRRMYLAHIATSDAPQPGDAIFYAEGDGQARIVDAQRSPQGGYDVLAVIPITAAESGTIRWRGQDGPKLDFLALPYPV